MSFTNRMCLHPPAGFRCSQSLQEQLTASVSSSSGSTNTLGAGFLMGVISHVHDALGGNDRLEGLPSGALCSVIDRFVRFLVAGWFRTHGFDVCDFWDDTTVGSVRMLGWWGVLFASAVLLVRRLPSLSPRHRFFLRFRVVSTRYSLDGLGRLELQQFSTRLLPSTKRDYSKCGRSRRWLSPPLYSLMELRRLRSPSSTDNERRVMLLTLPIQINQLMDIYWKYV